MGAANLEITADNAQFLKAVQESQEALAAAFEKMRGTIEGLVGTFEKVQKAVTGITSLLAGGAAFKEILESTVSWAEGSMGLAKALGITTERASVYQAALQHLGISNDVLINASDKVSKQIYTNSAAFEKMGIAVKDSNGQFRPSVDIIAEANEKLSEIHNTVERNIAGQQLYGKAWAEIRPLMRLTSEEMGEASKRAEELGLIVGPAGVAQAHAYKEGIADVGLVVKALQVQLGNELIPTLINAGRIFAESGPEDINIFGSMLKGVAYIAGTVAIEFQKMGLWIGAMAASIAAIGPGWSQADTAIKKQFDADIDELNKKADGLWDKLNRPVPVQKSQEPESGGPMPFDSKEKDTNQMAALEAQLETFKANLAEKSSAVNAYHQLSISEERAYWEQVLATTKLSAANQLAIQKKLGEEGVAIWKEKTDGTLAAMKTEETEAGANLQKRLEAEEKYAAALKSRYPDDVKAYEAAQRDILATKERIVAQQYQLDKIREDGARSVANEEIDTAEAEAKRKYDLKMISLTELIALEKKFQAERYAIQQEATVREMALMQNGPYDPVKMAQLQQQILNAAAQHNQAMLKIDQQANQQEIALQKQLQSTMTQGFTTAFESIIKGTATVHQAFTKMLDTVLNAVVSSIAKMIAQWITAAAVHLMLNRKETLANAGTAASGAMASAAAIPYVGWILAPIEGAAVYAAALGFSARGGYDIPAGVNPTGQLHEKEMVLPAPIAETIRAMAANGGGRGGAGGGFIFIQAILTRGVWRSP